MPHIELRAQQTTTYTCFKSLRSFISNVQNGRHLIAVLRAVTARGETHVLHHFGIYKTQTLLLTAANQKRTVYFDTIHIHRVLVKRTAADIILAAQLITLAHTGKSDQQALYRSAGCVRHHTSRRGINMIHRTLRVFDSAHLDLCQYLLVCQQLHIDIQHILEIDNSLLHSGIADHRKG